MVITVYSKTMVWLYPNINLAKNCDLTVLMEGQGSVYGCMLCDGAGIKE